MAIRKLYLDGKYEDQINSLKNQVNSSGIFFDLVNDFIVSDIYIAFDLVDKFNLNYPTRHKIIKVLIRQEPKIISPETYKEKNITNFDYIIDIGKANLGKFDIINWPQNLTSYINELHSKQDRIIMVNSNLLSLAKNENYSLRRCLIGNIENLDLYGHQWNNSFHRKIKALLIEFKNQIFNMQKIRISGLKYFFRYNSNYLGEVGDKRAVMVKYKYCLVIENSSEYLSEKLFDALLSGCIPIYVGPDLTKYEIPTNLYLQAKPNLVDVRAKISDAKKVNFNEWRKNLNLWLSSPKTYEDWSQDLFLKKIMRIIEKCHQ